MRTSIHNAGIYSVAQFRPQVFHPVVIQMGLLCLLSSCNNTHISSGWVNGVALGSSGGLGRGQYAGLGHMHRHHPITPPETSQTAACSLAKPDYNLARPVHDKTTSCKAKTTKTRLTYPSLCNVYRCSNQTASTYTSYTAQTVP